MNAYIIMARDECGDETRISDFDQHARGFDKREDAVKHLDKAIEYYPEFRRIWVELNKDMDYWIEHNEELYYEDDRDIY